MAGPLVRREPHDQGQEVLRGLRPALRPRELMHRRCQPLARYRADTTRLNRGNVVLSIDARLHRLTRR